MSPAPKVSRLRHIPVRLRVTVDPKVWNETGAKLEDDVRNYVVERLREHAALLIAVRRDGQ